MITITVLMVSKVADNFVTIGSIGRKIKVVSK